MKALKLAFVPRAPHHQNEYYIGSRETQLLLVALKAKGKLGENIIEIIAAVGADNANRRFNTEALPDKANAPRERDVVYVLTSAYNNSVRRQYISIKICGERRLVMLDDDQPAM